MSMIESLNLAWNEGQLINTRRGARVLKTAQATPAFWSAWRSNKEALKSEGVSCDKKDGNWQVCLWIDPSAPITQPEAILTVSREAAPVANLAAHTSSTNWSDEQNAIFAWFATGTGNLVVEAFAGTGKTTTIKHAFSLAPEAEILYAVFGKKNQLEAAEKITDPRVMIRTLHSLGYRFIKSVWSTARPDRDGENIEVDRVETVLGGVKIDDGAMSAILKLIGFAKNLLLDVTPANLEQLALERDVVSEEVEAVVSVQAIVNTAFKAIELSKQRNAESRISFNDMVWLPVVMGWVKPCFDLVVVDEGQDMNILQLTMAIRSCRKNGRICIVGDSRQAIFGFRGAATEGMELMRKTLQAHTLPLSTTYRCPKNVVAVAQEIVPAYKAADSAPDGTVDEMDLGKLLETVKIGDSILSRLNAPLVSYCLKLLKNGTPARIEGRDIGRQLINMVRKFKAKSVPNFLQKLAAWENKQVARITASGGRNLESRITLIRDQAETLTAIAEGADSIRDIENRLNNLFQDSEGVTKNVVLLSSVHKAKGLEWNRVFLLDATFKKVTEGEEANIRYVAITRAKQHLTFVK